MSALIFAALASTLLLLTFFFFNDTATTEIYTLSLHDALPISVDARVVAVAPAEGEGVAADEPDVPDGQLLRNRLRRQHPLARELVDALRARAEPAQQRRAVPALAAVAPGHAQLRVRLLHDLARLDGRPAPRRL